MPPICVFYPSLTCYIKAKLKPLQSQIYQSNRRRNSVCTLEDVVLGFFLEPSHAMLSNQIKRGHFPVQAISSHSKLASLFCSRKKPRSDEGRLPRDGHTSLSTPHSICFIQFSCFVGKVHLCLLGHILPQET